MRSSVSLDLVCVFVFVMSNLVVAMFRASRSPALLDTVMANAGMGGSSIHLSRAAVSGDVMSSSESFQVRSAKRPIFAGPGWGEGTSNSELWASKLGHHHFSQDIGTRDGSTFSRFS